MHKHRLVVPATLAAAGLLSVMGGAAYASGPAPVVATDHRHDVQLVDGPPGPHATSIDIHSMRWSRSGDALRVSVVVRRLLPDEINQYAVFRAVDPASGRHFLIQASTVTPVAHVAAGSWAHQLSCRGATGQTAVNQNGTGTIVATVPLHCLGRPATLRRLQGQTAAKSYTVTQYYSFDVARTTKVLHLRQPTASTSP